MAIREILLLGNPKLYEQSQAVSFGELDQIKTIAEDLQDTLLDFRSRFGSGRAIAAPQIGEMKRLIFMHIDKPVVMINPELTFRNIGMMEVWDDCLSIPGLQMKVQRYKRCHIEYRGLNWKKYFMELYGPMSELLQHECDHLNGILAISKAIEYKAIEYKAIAIRSEEKNPACSGVESL